MIRLNVEQGSDEWLHLRMAKGTSSCFHKIITPKGRKISASAGNYMDALLSEWMHGKPEEDLSTQFMARGGELEEEARCHFEDDLSTKDVAIDVDRIGFCMTDDEAFGSSPDGLFMWNGVETGLEIKCYGSKKHIGCLRGRYLADHECQIQGGMWVTGLTQWVKYLWHPSMPPIMLKMKRDEKWMADFDKALPEFAEEFEESKELLIGKGCRPKVAA